MGPSFLSYEGSESRATLGSLTERLQRKLDCDPTAWGVELTRKSTVSSLGGHSLIPHPLQRGHNKAMLKSSLLLFAFFLPSLSTHLSVQLWGVSK